MSGIVESAAEVERAQPTKDEGTPVFLSPTKLAYFCDNASMTQGGRNHGKNTNLPRESVTQKLASTFSAGCSHVSTLFILAAARKEWSTPLKFLGATVEAAKSTLRNSEDKKLKKAGKRLIKRAEDLMQQEDSSSCDWATCLTTVMWNYSSWGLPSEEFNYVRPSFITIQGQHRFAVFLLALSDGLGLARCRAGGLHHTTLFPEGSDDKTDALVDALMAAEATCSVVVYGDLTHVQASTIGYDTHESEKATNRPVLLDAIAHFSPLIKQVFYPELDICCERADEFLGPAWKETMSHKKTSKKEAAGRKKLIKDIQTRVKNGVQEGLRRIGLPPKFSTTPATLVYAASMLPNSVVVKKIVEYLQTTRDAPVDEQAKTMDCETMASIFRLSEMSQRKPAVWKSLGELGFTHPMRKKLEYFHRAELFQNLVTSVAVRVTQTEQCHPAVLNGDEDARREASAARIQTGKEAKKQSAARDKESVTGDVLKFLNFCLEICSESEADYFGGWVGNSKLRELVASADTLIQPFIDFAGSSFKVGDITRKVLAPGLGRIETPFPHLSNKTRTTQGGDSTGNAVPIFISISGTAVPIDRTVLREYLSAEKGHDARVMYLCFAFLLIDRALSKRAEGDGTPLTARFVKFLEIMPSCVAPLRMRSSRRATTLCTGVGTSLSSTKIALTSLRVLPPPAGKTTIPEANPGRRTPCSCCPSSPREASTLS
ncbi:unnamed protein product [Pylaiella littoralis]